MMPLDCDLGGRWLDCDRRACPEHVPAVPGDWRRSRALCGHAAVDAAVAVGGFSRADIAWTTGIDVSRVGQLERAGVARARRHLRVIEGGAS